MSAETLRAAATAMRERAQAAAPGPWAVPVANVGRVIAPEAAHTNPPIGKTPPYPWRVVVEAGDSHHAEDTAGADAEYIAGMHPAVALAVADLLRMQADHAAGQGTGCGSCVDYAVAVADAYLATAAVTP